MNQEIENGILPDTSELVDTENALAEKHDAFCTELDVLVEQYGINILFAANYKAENETAIEYMGEQNRIIELGLLKAISNKG